MQKNTLPQILIVDDIEENIHYLEVIISKFNVNLIKAYSGAEALEKTAGLDLALAIVDVWMPEMNGYELAQKINENKHENKVPVIFLTASLSSEIETLRGYDSGAVDYIFKPVNSAVIKSKVSVFLDLYKQKQKIANDSKCLKVSAEKLRRANVSLVKSENKAKKLASELKDTLANLEKLVQLRTEELSRSEELYYTTVNSLFDWIIVIDDRCNIVFLNSFFKDLLNGNGLKNCIVGKNIKSVLSFFDKKDWRLFESVFKTGKAKVFEKECEIFGKSYFVEVKLSPVVRDNKVVRVAMTIHDYSKQKFAEQEILNNLKREKELNELKTHFISTVSHEFRTPIAGILTSVQLLERYDSVWDKTKKEKLFKQVFDAINHTKSLLGDISLIDGEKHGMVYVNPKLFNLKDFLQNLIEENKQVYGTDFNIEFDFQMKDEIYFLDKEIVRIIIGNVISNAIKYSGKARKIEIRVVDKKHEVAFIITDYGIGIPVAEKKMLFEPFYRASNVGSVKGTGFGLSVVKKYIGASKGKISISSSVNKGTSVTIVLPHIKYKSNGK